MLTKIWVLLVNIQFFGIISNNQKSAFARLTFSIHDQHNRWRSNVFGDARFLFCLNLIKFAQIELFLPKICPNFAQA